MAIEITMPRLSDTMQQGTIVKWTVKEGQKVKSGDSIADIETDKATMELPTYEDGVIAYLAPEGQTVPVGTLIVALATGGEDPAAIKAKYAGGAGAAKAAPAAASAQVPAAAAPTAKAEGAAVASPARAVATALAEPPAASAGTNGTHGAGAVNGEGRIFASPLARKIAAESNVDLGGLRGSGPSGRIVRKDVEAALASGGRRGGGGGAATEVKGGKPAAVPTMTLPAMGASLQARTVALSNMRRTIARRLVESKTTIPHYQVTVEVQMDALAALRGDLNEQLASQGVKLSVNDFLVRACALAMHQHPYVNTRWTGPAGQESVEYVGHVHVGVAISLPVAADGTGGGLVVATIRNADQLGLRQVSSLTKQLAEKARGKGLSVEEMSDSTFTISNLGMYGVDHFTAIINPPNTAILAVGASIVKPVVKDGKIVPGLVMSMTMSSDHRVIDGAMAAQYLATVKQLLEKPATLLV